MKAVASVSMLVFGVASGVLATIGAWRLDQSAGLFTASAYCGFFCWRIAASLRVAQ